MSECSIKKTIKIGNWQEEKALENMMNGKIYDPKIKKSTALTNLRVIKHSANVDPKDYQTVGKGTYLIPQEHVEYKTNIEAKTKGPRERLREQMMRDTVESEFKMKEADAERERNTRYMITTSQESFKKEFTQTLRDKRSGLLTGEFRDPYYLSPSPITYYLHTLLSDEEVSFPVTTIGSLDKPWARGDSVSADIHNGTLRQFGTFENPGNPPTVKEYRILLKLRHDILKSCSRTSPPGLYGSTIRIITKNLLKLNHERIPRASIDDIQEVFREFIEIEFTTSQIDALNIAFTRYRDTRIILVEFIEYLRGTLSLFRSNLVYKAFISCNPDRDDLITEESISNVFNKSGASNALRQISNNEIRKSGEELLSYFLDNLQVYISYKQSQDSNIYELNDFMEYYRDVSCEIIGEDTQGIFESLLTQTWNITTEGC